MLITDPSLLTAYDVEYRVWQGIPSIERTAGGRLFVTFYSGRDRETTGNFCLLYQSDDNGVTWGTPIAAAYAGDTSRCFDPCLWIDPLGRLWFTWTQLPNSGLWASICDDPDADVLMWQDPFFIAPDIMMNKPTVLSTGEWLFPIAVWEYAGLNLPKNVHRQSESGAFVYQTADFGQSFQRIGTVRVANRLFDEHMIAELQNGILLMLVRTQNGIVKTYSYDRGHTWSTESPLEIPHPTSRIHIRRLRSGRLLMVGNQSKTARTNMTAYLSEDDGHTWSAQLLLDDRAAVAYPDAVEDENGNIYITYDRERGAFRKSLVDAQSEAREILFAQITESDILAGHLVSPNSRLQCVVSKLGVYRGVEDFYTDRASYSVEDVLQMLLQKDTVEDQIDCLFSYYPLNCADTSSTLAQEIDQLIDAIYAGHGNSEKNLRELIVLLNQDSRHMESYYEPLVARTAAYIRDHFTEEFNLSAIAEAMGIGKHYLCHIFKQVTDISMLTYRNTYRLTVAKQLLYTTDLPITDIGAQCGFETHSYFARIFKENEHITPSEFRRLHQKTVK